MFDYGPVGGRMLRRVQQAWVDHFLRMGNIVVIDSPTLTPHSVLEASGHVGAFNDHASECAACNAVFRSYYLVMAHYFKHDPFTAEEPDTLFVGHALAFPSQR